MVEDGSYNEAWLLSEVSRGSQEAFARVFGHYRANIYTTALRMTGSVQEAEEILQDTFVRVWMKRDSLLSVGNFGGWVYTIASNLTYNTLRLRRQERARRWEGLPLAALGEEVLEREASGVLERAIRQLPERQRETYLLVKEEGLSREEAARRMGVAPETVKWNLEQAMRKIRAFCMAYLELWPLFLVLFSGRK